MSGVTITSEPADAPAAGTPAPVVTETPSGGVKVTPPAAGTETPATPSIAEPANKVETPVSPAVPRIAEPPKKAETLDLSAALSDIGKDGKVSEDTYKAAEAKGLSRADLDTYVAGHQSRVEGVANKLGEVVGGTDNLKTLMQWASANTDAATREAFNKAVDSADVTTASLMLRGLAAQYNETVGSEGERVVGTVVGTGVQGYANWEQVRQDMRKPEYDKDPAFRDKVARRLAVSALAR